MLVFDVEIHDDMCKSDIRLCTSERALSLSRLASIFSLVTACGHGTAAYSVHKYSLSVQMATDLVLVFELLHQWLILTKVFLHPDNIHAVK